MVSNYDFENEWGTYVLTVMIFKSEWGNYALTVMIFIVVFILLKKWSKQQYWKSVLRPL
jgi:hypothetical protein